LEHIFQARVVGADETPIKYLPEKVNFKRRKSEPPGAPKPPPGNAPRELRQCKQGYFWTLQRSGEAVYFHWETSRSALVLEDILPQAWAGVLVCDDYAAYQTEIDRRAKAIAAAVDKALVGVTVPAPGAIVRQACLAHIRRKFHDIEKQHPAESGHVLAELQKVYRVEAKLKEDQADAEEIKRRRAALCAPTLDALEAWLKAVRARPGLLPQSGLAKAVNYALNQWPDLEPYRNNPLVPLDNNETERAIRPSAVGKKNWLFMGRAESGTTAAIFYTILGTAKLQGLNPETYLRDLLEALPGMRQSELRDWTPWAYAARVKAKAAAESEAAAAAAA
jgi:hypothetical protein